MRTPFFLRAKSPRRRTSRSVAIEPLEVRQLLAVTAEFDEGLLQIQAGATDAVVVTAENGLVKINGADPAFGALDTALVTTLRVDGGHLAAAQVDITPALNGALPNLTAAIVTLPDGADVDLITVDKYGDALFGKEWNETFAMPLKDVQTEIVGGTWEKWVDDSGFQALAISKGTAYFQNVVDDRLKSAGLPSTDLSKLKWFQVADAIGASKKDQLVALQPGEGPLDFFALGDGFSTLSTSLPEGDAVGPHAGPIYGPGEGPEGGTLSVTDDARSEDNGPMIFTITHHGEAVDGFSVDWTTNSGSATFEDPPDDDDYVGVHGTLTFQDGAEGHSYEVAVDLIQDSLSEPTDEEFTLELSNVTRVGPDEGEGVPTATDTGTGTIYDTGTLTVSISDAPIVSEASGVATFTVTISGTPSSTVSVQYATMNGSAVAGSDYTAESGTVTFTPTGPLSVDIEVAIIDDTITEAGAETFTVKLSNPSTGLKIEGTGEGLGIIIDDDFLIVDAVDDPIVADLWPPDHVIWPEMYGDETCTAGCMPLPDEFTGNLDVTDAGGLYYHPETNPHPIIIPTVSVPDIPELEGFLLHGVTVGFDIGGLESVSILYEDEEGLEASQLRIPILADASTLATDVYEWRLGVTFRFVDDEENEVIINTGASEYRAVINRADSEFGNRWWIDELDRLLVREQGIALITGTGRAALFGANGQGGYFTPNGWFDTMTTGGAGYILTSPDGTQREFDEDGLLVTRIDRNGNETLYAYTDADGDMVEDELETITDPFGRVTTYVYETNTMLPQYGKLKAITDYAGRDTLVNINTDGLVTSIVSPDPGENGDPLTTTYTHYAGSNLIESITLSTGVTTTYEYDFAGRLTTEINESDDTERHYEPIQTRGLVDLSWQGTEGNPAPLEYLLPSIAVGSYTDELDHTSYFTADRFGYVSSWTDQLGNTTTYERDHNGLLESMTLPDPDGGGPRTATEYEYTFDAKGRLLTLTYGGVTETWTYDDDTGQVTSYTDGEGRLTIFHLDEAGNVEFIQRVVGAEDDIEELDDDLVTAILYTDGTDVPAGLVSQITDAENEVTVFAYYGQDMGDDSTLLGLVKSITFADGTADEASVAFEYYTDTRMLHKAFDELDRVTEYFYDDLDRLTRVLEPDPDDDEMTDNQPEWLYDYCDCGRLASVTDPEGNTVEYDYNDRGWLETITLPKPVGTEMANPTWVYGYDAAGRRTSVTDPAGRETIYGYDNGNRLTTITQPDPDDSTITVNQPVWTLGYDAINLLTSVLDPEGRTTNYLYDARMRLTRVTLPDPDDDTSTVNTPVWDYTYNDADQLKTVTDPLDHVTEYFYDADLGWLTSIVLPDPDDDEMTDNTPVWLYGYDDVGNVTSVTDPREFVTDYEYDHRYRLVEVVQPAAEAMASRPTWGYVYDDAGQLLAAEDPEGRVVTYDYDDLGRVEQITEPDPDGEGELLSAFTAYTYDKVGNVKTATDALAHVTSYDYDHWHRLTTMTDPDDLDTTYTYDLANNLKTLTDPNSNTTAWNYDNLDRVVEEENELSDSRFYEYDMVGNLTKYTDRLGRITEYLYDDVDRLLSETWKAVGGATVGSIVYAYDAASRLTGVIDGVGGLLFALGYDDLDRLTSVTASGSVYPATALVEYDYDPAGNRTELALSLGGTLDHVNDYVYDDIGRLKRVEQHDGGGSADVAEKRVDFTYDLSGRFDAITRFADLAGTALVSTSQYGYDFAGRLTSLVHDPAAGGFDDLEHAWTYDRANRVDTFDNSIDGLTDYGYDARDQLETADRVANDEAYDYDDAGNRTEDGAASYTVGANNRLIFDGVYTYSYDAEGNRTARFVDDDVSGTLNSGDTDITLYEWDHRNRLTKVTHKATFSGTVDQIVKYLYDAFDRRVGKNLDSDGNGTDDRRERHVFDGWDAIVDLVDPDGAGGAGYSVAKRYLHGPAVDQILAEEDGSVSITAADRVLWPHADNQGTVRDLLDNTGEHVEHYVYDSFGELVAVTDGSGDPLAGPATRYTYAGREWDPDTGLYNYRFRWYEPVTAGFLSEDPIGLAGGSNSLYAYVGNSPTNATDPLGLIPLTFVDCGGDDSQFFDSITQSNSNPDQTANDRGGFLPGFIRDYIDSLVDGGRALRDHVRALWGDLSEGDLIGAIRRYIAFNIATQVESMYGQAALSYFSDLPIASIYELLGFPSLNDLIKAKLEELAAYLDSEAADQGGLFAPLADAITDVVLIGGSFYGGPARATQGVTGRALRPVGKFLESAYDVLKNPKLLIGKSPQEVETLIGKTPGWHVGTLGKGSHQGQGWIFREIGANGQPTGRLIQWHPGGGHHGPSPYWKVSSGEGGTIRIGPQFPNG